MPTLILRPGIFLGIYGALSFAPFVLDRGDAGKTQLAPGLAFAEIAIAFAACGLALVLTLRVCRRPIIELLRASSPVALGIVAAAAGSAFAMAYNACSDGHLADLPEIGACHCWVVGLAGMALGMLIGTLAAIVQPLVAPALVRLIRALITRHAPRGPQSGIGIRLEVPQRINSAALALCCAGRAPPIPA